MELCESFDMSLVSSTVTLITFL